MSRIVRGAHRRPQPRRPSSRSHRQSPAPTTTPTPSTLGCRPTPKGGQCTSNFVFQDASGVYLGQAAHCSGTGGQTETDGCSSGLAADRDRGRSQRRQQTGDDGLQLLARDAGQGRDRPRAPAPTTTWRWFELNQADAGRVNPSVPGFGGPAAVGAAPSGARLDRLLLRQLLAARRGRHKLSPKQGVVIQNEGGGWSHVVATLTPGIPGDSGCWVPQRLR